MSAKRAVLLIGSPRTPGNSESLGDGLCDNLIGMGWTVEKVRLAGPAKTQEELASLASSISKSDLFVLSAPLYADGVPAMVLRVFEEICRLRKTIPQPPAPGRTRMTAIFNCGFPETHQNAVALKICRLFAEDAGFAWAGGLAMGMGGSLGQQPLHQAGGAARSAVRALTLTAAALDQGKDVPPEAVRLMGSSSVPKWLYVLFGNLGWWWQAWKNKVPFKSLYDRPFARTEP